MSSARGIEYCPYRGNIDLSAVQYSDFSNVQFTQPEISEDEALREQGKPALN